MRKFQRFAPVVAGLRWLLTADRQSRVAAELEPNLIDLSIDLDFKDIAACVTSFLDEAYPLAGPTACP